MAESQVKTEGQKVDPPRFVWLRRGAIGFNLLLLTLVVLRSWWGHEANRRIAELARAAYVRGEPFYPEDFRQSPVPDDENAALPIQAAVDQIFAAKTRVPHLGLGKPLTANDLKTAEALVAQCEPELRLVRSARGRNEVVFPNVSLDSRHVVAHHVAFFPLARVLELAAECLRANGNDGQALEYIRDTLFLGQVVNRAPGPLFIHAHAMSLNDIADTFLFEAAMDLRLSEKSPTGATREQVRDLIQTLLDDQPLRTGAVKSYLYHRVTMMGLFPEFEPSMNWIIRPAYKLDLARALEYLRSEAVVCEQPNWPAAFAKKWHLQSRSDGSQIDELAHPLPIYLFTTPALGSTPDNPLNQFEIFADRDVLATMLAMRLYEIDHGEPPETLSALVPKYLPALPLDPFDPDNSPLRYIPHHSPPLLYSVGLDGKDDGGLRSASAQKDPMADRWIAQDVVYFLTIQPRIAQSQNPPISAPTRRRR